MNSLTANCTTSDGTALDLEGESGEALALELATYGEPSLSATVYDDHGFTRGWIHGNGEWRAT